MRLVDYLALSLLLLTVVFAPVAQGSLYPWSLFGFRSLVALALMVCGVGAALRGRLYLPPAWIMATYGGFLALYALSATLSPNPYGTQQALLSTFSQVAGFVLALQLVRGRRRQNAFFTALMLAGLVLGSYGVMQLLGHGFTLTLFDTVPPVSSVYYNRNHYAGFLDLACLSALGLTLFGGSAWMRVLSGGLALLLYANLGLTFSDAGWVSTGLATLGLLILWLVKAPARVRGLRIGVFAVFLCLGVTGLGTFLYNSPDLSGTVQQKLLMLRGVTAEGTSTNAGLGNLYSRLSIYEKTLHIIAEHPVSGVGPGNFIYAFPKWRPPTATDGYISQQLHRFVNYTHNDYLQIASEAGIPAALFFTAFWLSVLIYARKAPLAAVGLTFGLGALLVHSLVDGNLTINNGSAFLAYASAGVLVASRNAP